MNADGILQLRSSPSPRQCANRSSPWDVHSLGVRSLDLGTLARGELPVPADASHGAEEGQSPRQPNGSGGEARPRGGLRRHRMLRSLDLGVLPRDDSGPLSELQARRQKFALFEKDCSEVAPGLCVAGLAVARDRGILRQAGVTHVVNCVGMLAPATPFAPELEYLVLHLLDVNDQDITSVLFDVMDFIEAALSGGGRVLVHCSQGVSRSVALAVAYLMWKRDQTFYEAFEAVKAIRGVASPNIGFGCQLIQWQKRRSSPVQPARVYRLAAHSADGPSHLVPKGPLQPQPGTLDPRHAFLIQLPQQSFVWQGSRCPVESATAAVAAAAGFHKYEGTAPLEALCAEGMEPEALRAALNLPHAFAAAECRDYDGDTEMCGDAAMESAAEETTETSPTERGGLRADVVSSTATSESATISATDGTLLTGAAVTEKSGQKANQGSRKVYRSNARKQHSTKNGQK